MTTRLDRGRPYSERGDALRAAGYAAEAVAEYKRGLIAAPSDAALHIRLGNLLLTSCGETSGAAASYRCVLALQPKHREARIRLAHALKLGADYAAAEAVLRTLAVDFPADPVVPKEFGRLYFAQHDLDAAFASFEQVVRLEPRDADAHHWLAAIEQLRGHAPAALEHYRRTTELKPLMRVPAVKTPPDFSVLLLFSPGDANTPHETLLKAAAYDSYFLLLLPDAHHDADALRSKCQVVFNLISDVDQGREILPAAEALVAQLGLPVVNEPRTICKTDRESMAATLTGIAFCHVPQVRRCTAESFAAGDDRANWPFPLLIRVVGTHGGETFEKVDNEPAAQAFMAGHPGATFYLIQFVDYRSADGFFRKYRYFFVGDQILPYHLAIHDTWKVHHVTTDMASQPWMRSEEEGFLSDPTSVFLPQHMGALRAIRDAVGLDFFGIDCAIGRDGQLVAFEVNASMLVHGEAGLFAYKTPAIEGIKRAFDAVLRRKAFGGDRPP
jgi:tetratricopeptide (TPR) repeat protein